MAGLRLEAQIGADASGFNAVMGGLGKSVGGVASSIKSQLAAAFSVGAITAFSRATIDLAGRLRDVSDNLGVNVVLLQKLTNSAMLAGGSLEDIERFAAAVGQSRGDAVGKPGGPKAAAFARLGFSQSDVANIPVGEFLSRMAARVSEGFDGQGRNDFIEVGGKAAKKLIAGFAGGIEENGSVMSEDVINQLDDIGDKFTSLWQKLKSDFAPIIAETGNVIVRVVRGIQTEILSLYGFFSGGRAQAQKNRDAITKEFSEEDMRLALASQNRARGRRFDESQPPGFSPATQSNTVKVAQQQIVNGIKPYSDSLLAVGNFLGAGRGAISSVAQKQLEVARQQFDVQKQILNKLSDSGGINVPGI